MRLCCALTHSLKALVDDARAHLERLEAQRKLLVDARTLSLAQRQLLYAHDELSMATMRIRLRAEGEQVTFCLYPCVLHMYTDA